MVGHFDQMLLTSVRRVFYSIHETQKPSTAGGVPQKSANTVAVAAIATDLLLGMKVSVLPCFSPPSKWKECSHFY